MSSSWLLAFALLCLNSRGLFGVVISDAVRLGKGDYLLISRARGLCIELIIGWIDSCLRLKATNISNKQESVSGKLPTACRITVIVGIYIFVNGVTFAAGKLLILF